MYVALCVCVREREGSPYRPASESVHFVYLLLSKRERFAGFVRSAVILLFVPVSCGGGINNYFARTHVRVKARRGRSPGTRARAQQCAREPRGRRDTERLPYMPGAPTGYNRVTEGVYTLTVSTRCDSSLPGGTFV